MNEFRIIVACRRFQLVHQRQAPGEYRTVQPDWNEDLIIELAPCRSEAILADRLRAILVTTNTFHKHDENLFTSRSTTFDKSPKFTE